MTTIITGRTGQMGQLVISRTGAVPRSISVSERTMRMIAYTAWDSLQAIAQQYDADLVLAPGERLRLARRRDQSAPRATVRHLGKRLRSGLAVMQTPSRRRAS